MTKHLDPSTRPSRPSRARVGWLLVGAGALAVAISFFIPSGDDDGGGGEERERRATPVAAVAVERATLTERGRYPGELDADAADVSSFYTGRLTAVHVRVGDLVEKDQVLAEIDPIDAREQIARARAQADAAAAEERRAAVELGVARRQLGRFERLREQVSASEIDAQRALTESLGASIATTTARSAEARAGVRLLEKRLVESRVRAPFAGRVATRHVDPGVIVAAGAPLVRVAAVAPLRVRFEVPEQDVAALVVGSRLRVVTQASGDDQGATAQVTGVAGEVSRERRVATLEALVESPPASWLPGMYAQVIVDRRVIQNAMVVPANAVLSRLQADGAIATGVLVAQGDVARWVPVKVAAREDDRAAIEAAAGALGPGSRVLVAGHVDLTDGSPIQIAADRVRADHP
jgi:RND family efflux transporter MFP subunit